jgi:flagellar biosynthesis GTPase FlhF
VRRAEIHGGFFTGCFMPMFRAKHAGYPGLLDVIPPGYVVGNPEQVVRGVIRDADAASVQDANAVGMEIDYMNLPPGPSGVKNGVNEEKPRKESKEEEKKRKEEEKKRKEEEKKRKEEEKKRKEEEKKQKEERRQGRARKRDAKEQRKAEKEGKKQKPNNESKESKKDR